MDAFTKYNYSFYTIPVFWVLALAPRFYGVSIYTNATKKQYDGRQPRVFTETISREGALDARSKGIITRAEAATANGIENLGFFAAAVVAGNLGGLSLATLNVLTAAVVGLRFAYNFVYVLGERKRAASLRSVIYLSSTAILMTLVVSAGTNLNQVVDAVRPGRF